MKMKFLAGICLALVSGSSLAVVSAAGAPTARPVSAEQAAFRAVTCLGWPVGIRASASKLETRNRINTRRFEKVTSTTMIPISSTGACGQQLQGKTKGDAPTETLPPSSISAVVNSPNKADDGAYILMLVETTPTGDRLFAGLHGPLEVLQGVPGLPGAPAPKSSPSI